MSGENNLLLQSAHLKNNYHAMNPNEEIIGVKGPVKPATKDEGTDMDEGWRRYCSPVSVITLSGTIITLVFILILIMAYK